MTATALARIQAARLIARQRTPYFRPLLLSLIPVEKPGMGTIGVTKRGTMFYDPEVVQRWTPEQLAGGLVHECLHLWLRHLDRCGKHRNAAVFNFAGDLAMNPQVIETGLQLPPDGLMPRLYGWPDGLTADEYYNKLLELAEKHGGPEALEEGAGQQGKGNGKGAKPGLGSGACGGCAGHPGAGEPHEEDADDGSDSPAQTERRVQRMGRLVAELMRDHASKGGREAGRVPAGWLIEAEAQLEPPRVPWRQKLAHAIRAACSYGPGALAHRYDGASRLQAGIGWGPGKPCLPRLRTPNPRVAVIVDTSGSMGRPQLESALVEIRGILRAVGAEVTVCVCDAEVQGVKRVARIADVAGMLKGGGGTCMRPAFEAVMAEREPPGVIVCVTDGYLFDSEGGVGDIVHGARVIWALVGASVGDPGPYGEQVRVDAEEGS